MNDERSSNSSSSNSNSVVSSSYGQPVLREWQLTSNSTRYEQLIAAPSDETMHTMWSAWSVTLFLYSVFLVTVFLGVLSSRKVRKSAFNVYLIYLMVPDVVYTLTCAIQCACLAFFGGYQSQAACRFQSVYLVFGIEANSWLNGVIAYEVHKLLKLSARRQRYFPPTRKQASVKAALVFALSLCIAVLSVAGIPWLPHKYGILKGLVCVPLETDRASTIFLWAFFLPIVSFMPTVYALWTAYDILKNKYLPPTGKRRELAFYFFRILVCFVILWLPGILLFWGPSDTNAWVTWGAGTYVHIVLFLPSTFVHIIRMLLTSLPLSRSQMGTRTRGRQRGREFDETRHLPSCQTVCDMSLQPSNGRCQRHSRRLHRGEIRATSPSGFF